MLPDVLADPCGNSGEGLLARNACVSTNCRQCHPPLPTHRRCAQTFEANLPLRLPLLSNLLILPFPYQDSLNFLMWFGQCTLFVAMSARYGCHGPAGCLQQAKAVTSLGDLLATASQPRMLRIMDSNLATVVR